MRNALYMLFIIPLMLLQVAAPFLAIYGLIQLFS